MEGQGSAQEAPKDRKEDFSSSNLEHFDMQDGEYFEEEFVTHMINAELQEKVQDYISSFRKMTSRYLPLAVGQSVTSVCFDEGVLINIEVGRQVRNSDDFLPDVKTITDAFNAVRKDFNQLPAHVERIKNNQRPVDGTYIAALDSLIIIKGQDDEFWLTEQVIKDVDAILNTVEAKDNKPLKY